jgi:hypothetical protein
MQKQVSQEYGNGRRNDTGDNGDIQGIALICRLGFFRTFSFGGKLFTEKVDISGYSYQCISAALFIGVYCVGFAEHFSSGTFKDIHYKHNLSATLRGGFCIL